MSGKESKPEDKITSDGFGSTTWSLVLEAGRSEDAGPALERLCKKHWRPIYVFVRRSGLSPVDCEDATQEFFIEWPCNTLGHGEEQAAADGGPGREPDDRGKPRRDRHRQGRGERQRQAVPPGDAERCPNPARQVQHRARQR